ncbi:hypothetical protein L1049_012268 [Liquidambar formosana]|uniref:Serine-threonine/tyrosine-protein kinase catalytic domain-containing protein n=1 Tax=Liquidambar formosana TaxID=63359 RepID=A0AAP0RU14_LIQFO
MSEIASMSNISHENLVKLLGGCIHGARRLLVYDYMENNSLAQTFLAIGFDLELGEHYLVQKAWEMYKANKLLQLVDPMLQGNFPETEALRFLKVGLLCVQETPRHRPQMSTAVKMMGDEINIHDVQISQPGLLTDLMEVKTTSCTLCD